jgi:hypothetical protein
VPTAKEIRKANESAAAKLRSTAEEVAGKETNQTKKKQGASEFSLKSDDFVPLGAGTSNSSLLVNSTWRQNTSAEEVVDEVVEDAA